MWLTSISFRILHYSSPELSRNKGHCHTDMLANKKIAPDIEHKRKMAKTSEKEISTRMTDVLPINVYYEEVYFWGVTLPNCWEK